MKKQPKLARSREFARAEILALKDKTASVVALNLFGGAFKTNRLGYWLANFFILNLLMLGPWLILGRILDEFEMTKYLWISGVTIVQIVIAGIFVGYGIINDVFHKLAFVIVEKMEDESDLGKLVNWLGSAWSPRNVLLFILLIAALWFFFGAVFPSISNGKFMGVGFTMTIAILSLFAGMGFYVTFWVALLASNLGNYRYELDPILPADSEIVAEISNMLTRKIYVLAAYFAFFTLFGTSRLMDPDIRKAASIPFLLIVWALITAQFVLARRTLGRIVDPARSKTAADIRAKINAIRMDGGMLDKDSVEHVLRLMELHERVKSSKAEALDMRSIAAYVTQLILPLLGFLFANLDWIMQVF